MQRVGFPQPIDLLPQAGDFGLGHEFRIDRGLSAGVWRAGGAIDDGRGLLMTDTSDRVRMTDTADRVDESNSIFPRR